MKMNQKLKTMLAVALAAAGLTAAVAAPSVEITKAWQAKPGSGVVDFTYEVKRLMGRYYDVRVTVSAKGCANTAEFTIEAHEGTTTTNVNYRNLLGGVYSNVTLSASLEDCVQLWEGGPYFAKCNVGAKRPEETGYYFWWGDTVGYTNTVGRAGGEGMWLSTADGTTSISFSDDNSLNPARQTCMRNISSLQEDGWIGEDKNLVPAHDAAAMHLGAPWRMPTKDEILMILQNCNRDKVSNWEGTGVKGVIVRGKTSPYNKKSVFIPLAGYGKETSLVDSNDGILWASTPYTIEPDYSIALSVTGGPSSGCTQIKRCWGLSIRPVRDSVK